MATSPQILELSITNEDEAFAALEAALSGALGDQPVQLNFDHWPVLTMRYEGADFDSTVTPELAQAIIELQHALNRTYARHVLHTNNARSLTNEQRRGLQIKAKVEQGSSLINIDLGEFGKVLTNGLVGRMSSQDLMITVLGAALIGGSLLAWKAYLKQKSEGKVLDEQTRLQLGMSQQETRRTEILAEALTKNVALRNTQADFDDAKREFVRGGVDANTVMLQGLEMKASDAKAIGSSPRTASDDVQLNGHYIIQKLDWQNPEEVRMSLLSTDDPKLSFVAVLKYSLALPVEQKEKLQRAEWERMRLYMAINATRLRGEVTSARIVTVDWPSEDPQSADTGA
jgi:hypothetical protein